MAGEYALDGYVLADYVEVEVPPAAVDAPEVRRVVIPFPAADEKRKVAVAAASRRVTVAEAGS